MDLKDVPAIVTGGASGLGEATARALAARGAKVAIFDMALGKAKPVAAEIGGIAVQCDVSKGESAEQALAEAREKHGPCGVAVNCAGIGIAFKTVTDGKAHPLNLFEKVIAVNLVGTFNILRLAAAEMATREPNAEGERGVIINTASIAAFDGQMGQAAYTASKAGVAGMTLPIARDLSRHGIRVLTIAPGTFDTPMLAMLPEKARQSLAAQVPFPSRLGRPDDYAKLAMAIIDNPMLNGETIRLDGALRMGIK